MPGQRTLARVAERTEIVRLTCRTTAGHQKLNNVSRHMPASGAGLLARTRPDLEGLPLARETFLLSGRPVPGPITA